MTLSVKFGEDKILVDKRWTDFKSTCVSKSLLIQYEDVGDWYVLFMVDLAIVYRCDIWKQNFPSPSDYTQAQNDTDRADFEANYMPGANVCLEPRLTDGRVRTAAEKTNLSRVTIISHDWTDPTTWYSKSTRIVDDPATDSGDHLTYQLAHTKVIDTYHGKVFSEDYLKDAGGFSYRVAVKVNGTAKVEQDPHPASGGDFTVNYSLGAITFLSALSAMDAVTVTYHYAGDSTFIIKPSTGKNLSIDLVEIQFSTDVVITDSVVFQPYGYVDAFAPQYCPVPYPSGTLIPLGNPVVYKTMRDYQNDAVKSYPSYPAIGGSGWRGMVSQVIVMDWDYLSATKLLIEDGMQINLKLQHDVPFGGAYGTATFYCLVEDAT